MHVRDRTDRFFPLQDCWDSWNHYLANLRTVYSVTEELFNIYGCNGQKQQLHLISSLDNVYSRAGNNHMLLPCKWTMQTQSTERKFPGYLTEPDPKSWSCVTAPGEPSWHVADRPTSSAAAWWAGAWHQSKWQEPGSAFPTIWHSQAAT